MHADADDMLTGQLTSDNGDYLAINILKILEVTEIPMETSLISFKILKMAELI